jgi:hypothetical protein
MLLNIFDGNQNLAKKEVVPSGSFHHFQLQNKILITLNMLMLLLCSWLPWKKHIASYIGLLGQKDIIHVSSRIVGRASKPGDSVDVR